MRDRYDAVLRHLGTRDGVEFVSVPEMYHLALPDGRTIKVGIPHATPVRGLFFSGHWTIPGWGSFRSFASGVHTAAIILRELGAEPPIPPGWAEAANLPAID